MKKAIIFVLIYNTVVFINTVRADIDSNMVAYYNFESMFGIDGETVADQSGNGHNGICRENIYTTKAPNHSIQGLRDLAMLCILMAISMSRFPIMKTSI